MIFAARYGARFCFFYINSLRTTRTRDIILTMLKIFKFIIKLILLLVLVIVGINLFVKFGGERYLRTPDQVSSEPRDCIIVLGAGVYGNGKPTKILQDRLDRGIELYKAGAAPKLLLSGDNGKANYDEVKVMRNYCLEHGVSAEDIFLDHAGFSTYESMYRARAVFGVNSAVIVTQHYHEGRSLYTARRLGIEAVGVSAVEKDYPGDERRAVREFLSREKAFVQCLLKTKPTFLGDKIDIKGDGRVTW